MNPLSSILLAATGIEADRSATFTSTVVIAGIVIVLGILVLLIFVFKAFGAIVHGAETRGKKKKLKAMESQVTVQMRPAPTRRLHLQRKRKRAGCRRPYERWAP